MKPPPPSKRARESPSLCTVSPAPFGPKNSLARRTTCAGANLLCLPRLIMPSLRQPRQFVPRSCRQFGIDRQLFESRFDQDGDRANILGLFGGRAKSGRVDTGDLAFGFQMNLVYAKAAVDAPHEQRGVGANLLR